MNNTANSGRDPTLAHMTQALLHLMDGTDIARKTAKREEQQMLEYQLVTMLDTTLHLHSVSARMAKALAPLVSKEERPSYLRDRSETSELRIGERIKEQTTRYKSLQTSMFHSQMVESLTRLSDYYSEQSYPAPHPVQEERNSARSPIPEALPNRAQVLLLPQEILKVRIGKQSYQKQLR